MFRESFRLSTCRLPRLELLGMIGEGNQYFIFPNIGGLHGDFQCQKIQKSPEKKTLHP